MANMMVSAEALTVLVGGKIPPSKAGKYIKLLIASDLAAYSNAIGDWIDSAKRTVEKLEAIVKTVAEDAASKPLDKETTEAMLLRERENLMGLYMLREKVDETMTKLEKKAARDAADSEDRAVRNAVKMFNRAGGKR